jgi:hypothetical protein
MIPEGATVGVGGSLTLNQIGFYDAVQKRPVKLLNPFAEGLSSEEGARTLQGMAGVAEGPGQCLPLGPGAQKPTGCPLDIGLYMKLIEELEKMKTG